MKSKPSTVRLNFANKVVTKLFIQDLESYIACWKRNMGDVPFEEFMLIACNETPKKKVEKSMLRHLREVVLFHVEMWVKHGLLNETFDEYLLRTKACL